MVEGGFYIQFEQNSLMWKILYVEKKVSKAMVNATNVGGALEELRQSHLDLKKAGIVILSLAKIISKRFKFLLDDCNSILQVISKDKKKIVRSIGLSHNKLLTLNVDNCKLFLNDEMIDLEEQISLEEDQNPFETQFADNFFEPDFINNEIVPELSAIEQVRESTVLSSSLFNEDIGLSIKRRKILNDNITEIDSEIFRANQRTTSDIVIKSQKKDFEELFKSKLYIDPKIIEKFSTDTVENHRESVAFENGFEVDLEDNNVANFTEERVQESIEEGNKAEFNIETVPKEFEFNSLVSNNNTSDRARMFSSMLALASQGKIKVSQDEAFGPIICVVDAN